MKKTALLLALAFALGAGLFSACSDGGSPAAEVPETSIPSQTPPEESEPAPAEPPESATPSATPLYGEIPGDYKEISAEELYGAVAGVGGGIFVGDGEADPDWQAGFSFKTVSSGALELGLGPLPPLRGRLGISADYALVFANTGVGCRGGGSAEADFDFNGLARNTVTQIFNDDEYVYSTVLGIPVKLPYISAFGGIFASIFGFDGETDGETDEETDQETDGGGQTAPDEEAEGDKGVENFDGLRRLLQGKITVGSFAEAVASLGVAPYVDTSDGLKIKLSLGLEGALKLLGAAQSGYSDERLEIIEQAFNFVSYSADFYFAFDESGQFARAGYTYAEKFTLNIPWDKIDFLGIGLSASAIGVEISGGAEVGAYAGSVEFPADTEGYADLSTLF